MRYGVYCGSFAPLHNGHTSIMNAVLQEGFADKIIVVPTGDYWEKNIAVPLEKRIECLKLFESDRIIIDDDINDNLVRSTCELMDNLRKKYPEDELALILGADNLLKFEDWAHSQKLLDNYRFIIMNRGDVDAEAELERLGKTDYDILSCPRIKISSSYIMKHLQDEAAIRGLIDHRVLALIRDHGFRK